MKVIEIKESEFFDMIKSGKVLVDCYADWCGPCKLLGPIIDEIAKENDSYSFYKINVDDAYEVTETYNINAIPLLLIFNDGKLINTSIGLKSKEEINELIK